MLAVRIIDDNFRQIDYMPQPITTMITKLKIFESLSAVAAALLLPGLTAHAEGITSEANNRFAIDLYKQLSTENSGKNLFFSPYSISSALAMTIEGARGETAAEMGKVLGYPESIKQKKDSSHPWRTSLVHSEFQKINQSLHSDPNDPKTAAIRKKIDALREKLAEAKKATKAVKDVKNSRKWKKQKALVAAEKKIVDELNALSAQVDQFEINIANALWAEKTYSIEKPYLDTITQYYETGVIRPADFKKNFNAERLRINGWVEEKTKKRINDLIPDGVLDDLTRLVLVNAIYFKGDWASPFKVKDTKELPFFLGPGEETKVKTMQANNLKCGRYGAFNDDGSFFKTPAKIATNIKTQPLPTYPGGGGFAIAELPYKGNELSMVLIAPMKTNGLAGVEKQLTSERLSQWIKQLEKRDMHVRLPKCKLEMDYKLGDSEEPATLQKMGMTRAFTDPRKPNGADFTGMHDTDVLEDRLYISQVLHKAFLDVNEKGTEAAAATAVVMPVRFSIPMTQPFTPTFKADRPFLLMIRHNTTGSILFMGRVMNPTAK
jgi:serpin B